MIIISFSGLDGCGKSTHVALTRRYVEEAGLRARELATLSISATGVLARLREARARRRARRSPSTVNSAPLLRGYAGGRSFDQDRRHWSVHLRRMLIYPLDCVVLRLYLAWLSLMGYDAVVCDRYTYDKMVGLPLPTGRLSRLMLWLVPRPALAVFLEVAPQIAAVRKPEHHADYYVTKDEAYLQLVEWRCGLRAIPSESIRETQEEIQSAIDPIIAAYTRRAHRPCSIS